MDNQSLNHNEVLNSPGGQAEIRKDRREIRKVIDEVRRAREAVFHLPPPRLGKQALAEFELT